MQVFLYCGHIRGRTGYRFVKMILTQAEPCLARFRFLSVTMCLLRMFYAKTNYYTWYTYF
jgi:hypothetical protein